MKRLVPLALALVTLFCPIQSMAKTLNFTAAYAEKHPVTVKVFFPWIEELKNTTNGSLVLTYFPPNTICPGNEVASALADGGLDVGAQPATEMAGLFARTTAMAQPLVSKAGEAGTEQLWNYIHNNPEVLAEFKAFQPLAFWAAAGECLHTVKKPVRTLEDLKGMKIIVSSQTGMDVMRALGAQPIHQSGPDTYMALQRNMADGVLMPIPPMRSFKVNEATKFTTVINLYAAPFYMGMSKSAWNDLSEAEKKAVSESTGLELSKKAGKTLDEGIAADRAAMESTGHTFIDVSPEEKARWVELLLPLRQKWIDDNNKRGIDNAAQLLEAASKS